MKDADESVAPSDTAPVQNPAAVYLDRLHPSGRRSMRRELDRAVAIFTDEAVTDATAFDWSRISRRQVERLRSVYGRPRRRSRHRQPHAFGGAEYGAHSMGTRAGRRQDANRCRGRTERGAVAAPACRTIRQTGRGSPVVRGGYRVPILSAPVM